MWKTPDFLYRIPAVDNTDKITSHIPHLHQHQLNMPSDSFKSIPLTKPNDSQMSIAAYTAVEAQSLSQILNKAGKKAIGGGIPGMAAMAIQVFKYF